MSLTHSLAHTYITHSHRWRSISSGFTYHLFPRYALNFITTPNHHTCHSLPHPTHNLLPQIEKCFKCGKALEGPVVEVIDKSYHQVCHMPTATHTQTSLTPSLTRTHLSLVKECFGCHTCGRKLTTKCLNVEGFPYCEGYAVFVPACLCACVPMSCVYVN